MGNAPDQRLEALLLRAAAHVVPAAGAEPWHYGWFLPEYRASASAALAGTSGPVTIAAAGRAAYEQAVEMLAREPRVRERWDAHELWGVVAGFVVRAAEEVDTAASISAAVRHL